MYRKSEIRGRERKEWKFLNIPEVIIGLKIDHFLHEGRKEENEASVSARFYLLNLCLFSNWHTMAIQFLFLTSQSGYEARPPQWKGLSPAQLHSHWLQLTAHPCIGPHLHPAQMSLWCGHRWADTGSYDGSHGWDMQTENDTLLYRGKSKSYINSNAPFSAFLCPGFMRHRQNPKWFVDLDAMNIWGGPCVY